MVRLTPAERKAAARKKAQQAYEKAKQVLEDMSESNEEELEEDDKAEKGEKNLLPVWYLNFVVFGI